METLDGSTEGCPDCGKPLTIILSPVLKEQGWGCGACSFRTISVPHPPAEGRSRPLVWHCNVCGWDQYDAGTTLRHAINVHRVADWDAAMKLGRYVDVVCPACKGEGRAPAEICRRCLGRGFIDRLEREVVS